MAEGTKRGSWRRAERGLFRHPKTGIWHFDLTVRGAARRRGSTGTRDREEARQVLARLRADVPVRAEGRRSRTGPGVPLTDLFAVIVAENETRRPEEALRPFTVARYGQLLRRHVLPEIAVARELTTERVRLYQEHRRSEGAHPRTVRNETAVISRLAQVAVRTGVLARLPEIEWPTMRSGFRPRLFTDEQVRACLDRLTPASRRFAAFAWFTGLRPATLEALRWTDVTGDLDGLLVRAEADKAGRERTLPLAELPEARAVLAELRSRPRSDGRVFGPTMSASRTHTGLRREWAEATRAVLGEAARFYDLRGSRITRWLAQGIPTATVAWLVGDRAETVMRYYARSDAVDAAAQLRRAREATSRPTSTAHLRMVAGHSRQKR